MSWDWTPFRSGTNEAVSPDTKLELFSGLGQLIWSYVPTEVFQFGSHRISSPWVADQTMVSTRGGKTRLWVSFVHRVWGNSFLVNLDPITGKDTLRFVNTGGIRSLNEIHAGEKDFLLAGGFNNEADTSSLAVMDESKPFAASPQTHGTRHECLSCPAGVPDYYIVFPRSEIYDILQVHEETVIALVVNGNQIEAIKGGPDNTFHARVHYVLKADEGFRPISIRFNSDYDTLHRQYEREGKLNHRLENCPERLHPRPIRTWTASAGWTVVQLAPTPYDQ